MRVRVHRPKPAIACACQFEACEGKPFVPSSPGIDISMPDGAVSRSLARARRFVRDPVYGNGIALVLNAAVGAGLGFAFWMVAARLFEAGALGYGAAVVSAATLAALVGKAGFDAAVVRFLPGSSRRFATLILAYALAATIGLTTACALVVVSLTRGPASSLAALREPLAAAGFVVLATMTAAAWILDAFFLAQQSARVSLLRNVAFQIVKLALLFAVVGLLAGFAIPLVWALGVAVSLAVSFAFVPAFVRRHPRRTTTRASDAARVSRRDVARYAAQNYMLNLAEFAPGLVLPIVVLETLGSEANASFYLAWTVATTGFLASKAVAQSAFAQLVREGPPGPAIAKGAKLSLLVLGPFVLALLVGAELVLSLFGGGYRDSAPLLRVLALSVPAMAVSNHFLAYLKARRASAELTLVPLATMLALAAALPLALLYGGVEGVGYAWLAVQAAAGLYALVRLNAILRRTPDGPRTSLHRRAHQG